MATLLFYGWQHFSHFRCSAFRNKVLSLPAMFVGVFSVGSQVISPVNQLSQDLPLCLRVSHKRAGMVPWCLAKRLQWEQDIRQLNLTSTTGTRFNGC